MLLRHLAKAALAATAAAAATTTGLTNFDDWEHGRVALENVSIHFRYAGSGPPLLLVHGNPQFSLTWRTIGPGKRPCLSIPHDSHQLITGPAIFFLLLVLAQNYTVIAPDNRGAGDSSIPPDGDYSAEASAEDLKGVLDFLNISSTYVFSHDKGVGFATALAIKYPEAVKMLGVSEYLLPGFGYQQAADPGVFWDLYQNPQLAFFQIPDFAEALMAGREKNFLEWYFYHASYSGTTAFPEDIVNRYASSIAKPGFLRAMLGPFSAASVAADTALFNSTLPSNPLAMPVLGLGGEASFGLLSLLQQVFGSLGTDLELDIVPKAGHWLGDENPVWVANRIAKFLENDASPLESIDLSWFKNAVTLTVGYLGTLRNLQLAGL
ncbi:Alpha/Beta hydrolase protein [Xylariales sp. PMI_506]|nr:Alpha/Beta hydrolase protein [Xylariales sp. PMI_506]